MPTDENKTITYPKVHLEDTELRRIRSRFTDQEYQLQIYQPQSYSDFSKSYPVLYLLDSDTSFGMAKDIVQWLIWFKEIPEMMIVGPAYGEGMEQWWSKRSRDYTPWQDSTKVWGDWPLAGEGESYINFLREELITFVDANYRTSKNDRAIAGISFGGLFASYVLFKEPELFNRYIIIAPALLWNDKAIFRLEEEFSKGHNTLEAIVYSVVGELDDAEKLVFPFQEFFEIVGKRRYKKLKLTAEIKEGETHMSVYPGGFTQGLRIVFSWE